MGDVEEHPEAEADALAVSDALQEALAAIEGPRVPLDDLDLDPCDLNT